MILIIVIDRVFALPCHFHHLDQHTHAIHAQHNIHYTDTALQSHQWHVAVKQVTLVTDLPTPIIVQVWPPISVVVPSRGYVVVSPRQIHPQWSQS